MTLLRHVTFILTLCVLFFLIYYLKKTHQVTSSSACVLMAVCAVAAGTITVRPAVTSVSLHVPV